MIDGILKILKTCADIKIKENVLIVTDSNMINIAELFRKSAIEIGAETVVMSMCPRKSHGEEPPITVATAMKNSDVVLLPTTFSLCHTKARIEANKAGVRIVNLPSITEDALSKGGIEADFLNIEPIVLNVQEKLSNAKEAHITTPAGTNISMVLGRKAQVSTCLARGPSTFASIPIIGTFLAPMEGTANGIIIIDGSVLIPEIGLLKKPIKLKVENGYVIDIQGGTEANRLKKLLENYNDPNVYNIAELQVHLNPYAKLCGKFTEDEASYGTCHMAIGSNFTMGGTIRAATHIDFILKEPTIELDNIKLVKDGKIDEMEKLIKSTQ